MASKEYILKLNDLENSFKKEISVIWNLLDDDPVLKKKITSLLKLKEELIKNAAVAVMKGDLKKKNSLSHDLEEINNTIFNLTTTLPDSKKDDNISSLNSFFEQNNGSVTNVDNKKSVGKEKIDDKRSPENDDSSTEDSSSEDDSSEDGTSDAAEDKGSKGDVKKK